MKSLFKSLYTYKQSDQRHQKENFLIELLGHCLKHDEAFRERFLISIAGFNDCIDFSCQTQSVDKDFGKPDLLIKVNNDTIILIECKVEATQEETQLSRYCSILRRSGVANKYLVFLTKYYEPAVNNDPEIKLKQLRWYNIFDFLKGTTDNVSKELSKFLIEEKMANAVSFTISDLNAIRGYQQSVAKMNEFLNRLEDILIKYTEGRLNRQKSFALSYYGISATYNQEQIWCGFHQFENHEEVQLCVSFTGPDKLPHVIKQGKVLENAIWESYHEDNGDKTWYIAKNLSFFIRDGNFQTNEAYNFIESQLQLIPRRKS